jgi:hypothetical protein
LRIKVDPSFQFGQKPETSGVLIPTDIIRLHAGSSRGRLDAKFVPITHEILVGGYGFRERVSWNGRRDVAISS